MLAEIAEMLDFETLGTLGDETGLTCSMSIAKKRFPNTKIVPFARFELAAESAKAGHVEAFLVPGAYPQINHFIMDSGLEALGSFIATIPALVVVSSPCLDYAAFVFHHPATAPLLTEIDMPFGEPVVVGSNIEACKTLLSRSDSAAITNSLCAEGFSLHVRKVLRPGIRMPWVYFVPHRATP